MNPILGHEGEYTFEPAERKKKVAVVGGGITGCAAAIAAKRRGHTVELFEKSDRLGGQFRLAAVPPAKQELAALIVWQEDQLERLGVPVHYETGFCREMAQRGGYDAVILATGAIPIVPDIDGVGRPEVMTAAEVLGGTRDPGHRAAVIGGGQVGAETAAFLAAQNKEVVILEMRDKIPAEGEPGPAYYLRRDLEEHGVELITQATVKRIAAGQILYEQDGKERAVTGLDDVILAIGSRSYVPLKDELQGAVEKLVVAGDAERAGKGLVAHAHGFAAGYYI